MRGLLWVAVLLYLPLLLGLTGLIYGPGERFWPVTFYLFGPRWVLAVPLLALALACLFVERWLLVPLAIAAVGLAGPLFGFNVPWRSLGRAPDPPGQTLKVATWNVGGERRRGPEIRRLLESEQPDVLVLQECRRRYVEQPGWHQHYEGRMCLLSRFPILDVAARDRKDMWEREGHGAILRYGLDTPVGRVDLTHIHLETPREGLEAIMRSGPGGIATLKAKNEQREMEARLARSWAAEAPGPLTLVVGDFNTPVESHLFRENWGGFRDCHATAGWGFGFTKRTRRIGVRIDHVLTGPALQCFEVRTVSGFRGDHRPLVTLVGPR